MIIITQVKKGKSMAKRETLIKLYEHKNGYLNFNVYFNSYVKNYRVRRYVFECIRGNIRKNKVVDHIDNNKKNNRIDSLQLLTAKENSSKCRRKNKTKEIQINVTIVNICVFGSKREELYKLITKRATRKSK